MNLHRLFNAALLSLAMATVLLTLISFLLHKLRELDGGPVRETPARRSEGVYFTLYTSKGAEAARDAGAASVPGGPPRWRSLYAVILVLASVLFVSVATQWKAGAGRPTQAAGVAELSRRGLMRTYDFAPKPQEALGALREEHVPEAELKNLEAVLGELRRLSVLIWDPPSSSPRGDASPARARAAAAWRAFLKDAGLGARSLSALEDAEPGSLVLMIHPGSLSSADRQAIDRKVSEGVSFVATGPVGSRPGEAPAQAAEWTERTFGVRFVPNPEPASYLPVVFSGTARPIWDLPPGLLLQWSPLDNRSRALPARGITGAWEAGSRGELRDASRAQFVEFARSRAAWLALEPVAIENSATEAGRHQIRASLASALAWTGGVPMGRVAPWRDGARSAAVLAVDSEDKFENVEFYVSLFKRYRLPATFFVVSHLLRDFPKLVEDLSPSMEVVSHSEDHRIFQGQAGPEQFERIQFSRLEIEELTRSPVKGFRPPEEKYDDPTLDAALQNRIEFFFGDRRHSRYAPVWIAGGKMLYYPRALRDDFVLSRTLGSSDPGGIAQAMLEDLAQARKVGGAYFFSAHTHVFGRSEYHRAFERTVSELARDPDVWKTTFGGLSRWWKERSAIRLRFGGGSRSTPGSIELRVSNLGDQPVESLDLELDPGPRLRWAETTEDPSAHWVRDVSGARKLLRLNRLQAGEERVVRLKAAPVMASSAPVDPAG